MVNWKKKRKINEIGFLISVFAIPVAAFLLFWVYVNFQSILNAFRIEKRGEIIWSLNNWKNFWLDLTEPSPMTDMKLILKNTLIFFSTNMFVIIPISLIFSYFLFKKIKCYKIFRIVFFAPSIISAAVLATLYKFMLNPSIGGFLSKFLSLFNNGEEINYLVTDGKALKAVVAYCIWTGLSVDIVLFNGAMERVPKTIIESAQIDGVNSVQEFIRILFPMIWPTISTIIITTTAGIFTASGPLLLLTGGAHQTNTISFWIYQQVQAQVSPYYPSTVGLVFTLVGVPIVLIVKRLVESIYKEVQY